MAKDSYMAEYLDVNPDTDFATVRETQFFQTLDEAKNWCEWRVNFGIVGGSYVSLRWEDRVNMLTGDLFL